MATSGLALVLTSGLRTWHGGVVDQTPTTSPHLGGPRQPTITVTPPGRSPRAGTPAPGPTAVALPLTRLVGRAAAPQTAIGPAAPAPAAPASRVEPSGPTARGMTPAPQPHVRVAARTHKPANRPSPRGHAYGVGHGKGNPLPDHPVGGGHQPRERDSR